MLFSKMLTCGRDGLCADPEIQKFVRRTVFRRVHPDRKRTES
jgi:hypothetical protein